MNVKRLYLITSFVSVVIAGCTIVTPDPVGPQKPEEPAVSEFTDDYISFDCVSKTKDSEGSTKVLLTNYYFNQDGHKIKVNDYVDYDYGTVNYIDDVITKSGASWSYDSQNEYPWTRTGKHTFFGWYIKDGYDNLQPSNVFGQGFTPTLEPTASGFDISFPETEMDQNTPHFDFLYSDIVSRTMYNQSDDDHTPVHLSMNHLFTSFCLGADNKTAQTITIQSVTITGLKNNKSAILHYNTSTNSTSVEYADVASTLDYTSAQPTDIPGGERADDIMANAHTRYLYMIWPQVEGELTPQSPYGVGENGVFADPSDPLIFVTYTIGDDTHENNVVLPFPQETFEAGVQYLIDLVFADKIIEFTCQVMPWDYSPRDVDFTESLSIKEGHKLSLLAEQEGETYTVRNDKVFFLSTNPITCQFQLDTPRGAIWTVSLEGDYDSFEILSGSGVIDDNPASFMIKPTNFTADRDLKVTLHFSVRLPNGRSVDADSEIIATDYNFYYPRS